MFMFRGLVIFVEDGCGFFVLIGVGISCILDVGCFCFRRFRYFSFRKFFGKGIFLIFFFVVFFFKIENFWLLFVIYLYGILIFLGELFLVIVGVF